LFTTTRLERINDDDDDVFVRGDWMVRVKAQVMTRDESTGGWVPLGRGGMSVVGLRRLTTATDKDVTTEYRLHGQRIADQSVGGSYDCTRLASVVSCDSVRIPVRVVLSEIPTIYCKSKM